MEMQKNINTRAIQRAHLEEIESLYKKRQVYLDNLSAIQQRLAKLGESTSSDIVTQMANEETSLKKIEDRLKWMGMPVNPDNLVQSYSSVTEALRVLRDAREVVEWVKAHFPQQFKQKEDLLNSPEHSLHARLTGSKWNGTWRSMSDPTQMGKVIMAICQVDDELIGSGAFTNSMFSLAYLHGFVRDDTIEISLFADYSQEECTAIASIREENKTTIVRGTYAVSGWDRGDFEAVLDKSASVGMSAATISPNNMKDLSVEQEDRITGFDVQSNESSRKAYISSKNFASPINVFISYSSKDSRLLQGLLTHLTMLQRRNIIRSWYDGKIEPGTEWDSQIEKYLDTAQVILLLISSDFLASDFCYGREMARAIERHEAGKSRVIPIILRQVDWKIAPFAKLQVLPTGAKPVTEWTNRDAAWTNVAKGIRMAAENLLEP